MEYSQSEDKSETEARVQLGENYNPDCRTFLCQVVVGSRTLLSRAAAASDS